MSLHFSCNDPSDRLRGLGAAASALKRGDLVVLPTDTVYGVGADAFNIEAIDRLLSAKGRGRDMPVPVLVGSPRAVDGLAYGLTSAARDLIEAFWPGPLTVVVRQQPSLSWDLGDARGTVALRMPLHPVAIELLRETGPLGVSSANKSGSPAARDVDEAQAQLGDAVAIYLDGGPSGEAVASTIVDVTGAVPIVLRMGALDLDLLRSVVPNIQMPEPPPPPG